jgi:cobalamin biosynthesis Mg chelatase CobN
MDAILDYLDSLFAGYPDSPEKTRLKAEKLSEMQKRYESLIREGKNADEASGIVISEAGSTAKELKDRLGSTAQQTGSASCGGPQMSENGRPIIIEERYRRRDRRYAERSSGSMLYSLFWLIVVIVYLGVSYFTHAWSITWLIPAAAGIIFFLIHRSADNQGK